MNMQVGSLRTKPAEESQRASRRLYLPAIVVAAAWLSYRGWTALGQTAALLWRRR